MKLKLITNLAIFLDNNVLEKYLSKLQEFLLSGAIFTEASKVLAILIIVIAVYIVYMIIPIIISAILAVIFQHWLSGLITFLISILFALALMMGQCRLAKTEDIFYAVSVGEEIGDISKVGILKVVLFIILIFVISFVLLFIVGLINQWNTTVGGILLGILGVYLVFFNGRATGLLYSDV